MSYFIANYIFKYKLWLLEKKLVKNKHLQMIYGSKSIRKYAYDANRKINMW